MPAGALVLGLILVSADAQLGLEATLRPATAAPGGEALLELALTIPAGWHLWTPDPGPGPSALSVELDGPVSFVGPWHATPPVVRFDRGFQRDLRSFEGQARLERKLAVKPGLEPGLVTIALELRGQICSEETCIYQKLTPVLELRIAGPTEAMAAAPAPTLPVLAAAPAGPPAAPPPNTVSAAPSPAAPLPTDAKSLWSFLLLAFLAGLGALATPCVFPAIPLTVSFFSRYSEESFGRGARLASVYALTMVGGFTLGGIVISVLFGVTGIQRFAAHPAFNLALGGILVLFSLSLLGMYEIRTPGFLLQLVNRLEGRFGPNAGGRAVADYVAVMVAAMTATTVFFTCTVAFVGVVVVAAAHGDWLWPTVGMLVFSATFAMPFFLLALFPQGARRLRGRSGAWLKTTSVMLGFLELAAAIKFFSNADLVLGTNVLSRELALAFWIALFGIAGFYLIGKVRFGEEAEGEGPERAISVPRMLVSAVTFAFTILLVSSLFSGRSLGGWLDGWLPPLVSPGQASPAGGPALAWLERPAEARAKAAAEGKLVFVNYTGYTCTNCRYMEGGVFPRPEIRALLERMVLLELYTDAQTPESEAHREQQLAKYGTAALPFYAIETPDGRTLATFPSSTNDPGEFRAFLESALAAPPSPPPAAAPPAIALDTRRLDNDQASPVAAPGKWTLVNFWATWCAPCRLELKEFLAKVGADLAARGGHFSLVAVEDPETRPEAKTFLDGLGVAAPVQLYLEPGARLDPKLGFDGASLPFTALVRPDGTVAWRAQGKLDEAKLRAVLTEHTGFAAR